MSDNPKATGETNLERMLANLKPELAASPFVFCSLSDREYRAIELEPQGIFREQEGVTLILTQAQADDQGLPYEGIFACITLRVHSSLQAVGLMAAVSTRLAEAGISVNPVAGFYHDHLFVPWERRGEAMALLLKLQNSSPQGGSNSHPRL